MLILGKVDERNLQVVKNYFTDITSYALEIVGVPINSINKAVNQVNSLIFIYSNNKNLSLENKELYKWKDLAQKLLVGGITSGVSALYSYFTGEFEPQEPGETMEEYMARRRERVKSQMRQVMDSYYTPLRNPEYAAMSDEQKDNFIDGIVGQGLAAGGMPTGIMRTNKAGVMERDYRDEGGFVPVGIKEKADDVPAMLSKNEFVMTADAVRGAGNGSIEKGAQKMYETMKRLEKRVV